MLMPPHTVVPKYHHSVEGLNVRSRGSMNNVSERGGDGLIYPSCVFHIWWYGLTKDLLSLFLLREGFLIAQ